MQDTPRIPNDRRGRTSVATSYVIVVGLLTAVIVVSQFIPASTQGFLSTVPPLFAGWNPVVGPWLLVSVGLAITFSVFAPRLLRLEHLSLFFVILIGCSLAFSLLLNIETLPRVHSFVRGGPPASVAGIIEDPFSRGNEYFAAIPAIQIMGVRTFDQIYPSMDRAGVLPQHASTHAPGGPVVLWALWRMLGRSRLLVSIAVALIGVIGSVPTYAITREIYGKSAGQRAAVLFSCSAGVLLYAFTSMDVVFMTTTAVAFAAAVRARRSAAWAFVAGILTVAAASLNWGAFSAILIGLGMGVVALREGSSFRALLLRGAAGVAGILSGVLALNLLLGINLIQDFAADTGFQRASTTYSRPAAYWIVGSLAAFFISAGVAQSSLFLTEIRSRWKARTFGFETVVLIAIVLVDLSTVYRGETDRAWLFLLPLVVGVAAAARERVRASVGVSLTQSLAEGVLLYTWW